MYKKLLGMTVTGEGACDRECTHMKKTCVCMCVCACVPMCLRWVCRHRSFSIVRIQFHSRAVVNGLNEKVDAGADPGELRDWTLAGCLRAGS